MNFGTLVELQEDFVQGYTTFTKGTRMAVCHYSHKYYVDLNTYGEERTISKPLRVRFDKVKALKVIGTMEPVYHQH